LRVTRTATTSFGHQSNPLLSDQVRKLLKAPIMSNLSFPQAIVAGSLLATGSLLAQAPQPTWVDRDHPGSEGAPDERWVRIRVVDKFSGQPISRAELLLIAEKDLAGGDPIDGWSEYSDDDGFISARVDKGALEYRPWNWLCLRAPGYGQHMRMGGFDDEVVELSPGIAVPVQIRDWRNDPVEGALVGFCAGCGHTPDLVHGHTSENGLVTLPGIDLLQGIADFYVAHPDLVLGYDSPDWLPSKHPLVMRLAPGIAHRGVVVDHLGAPVPGALVGLAMVHRGPWTRTKSDGSFETSGFDQTIDLRVLHGGRKTIFGGVATDGLRLQLPKPTDEMTVVVEQPADVYARHKEAAAQRDAIYEQSKATWPTVTVRTVGMPKDGSVSMRTRRERFDLDELISTGRPVPIPDGEYVWELSGDGWCSRIIRGDRERALRDGIVRLRWYQDTLIEGRIVDASGRPLDASVHIEPLGGREGGQAPAKKLVNGAISMPVTKQGVHMLVVHEQWSGAKRKVLVDLPPRGDEVFVDVGTIIISEQSPVRIHGPDGEPLKDGEVRLHRLGFHEMPFEQINSQWWGPDLRSGDYIEIASELDAPKGVDVEEVFDVPSRFQVEGQGPWTFRQHDGQLLIDIDADGVNVGVTIGRHFFTVDQPTLLRGLPAGTHRVFLSATGRRSASVDVDVPPARAGIRTLKMALPARQ